MSLVEMLVAIAILSLGMAAFSILMMRAWSFKGYALEQAGATASSSRALTQLVHELRSVRQGADGSYPIKEIGQTSLTVYRDEDNDDVAERVHYFLEGEMLKKGVTKYANGAYSVGDETVETLLNYVTNIGLNERLFFYYNNEYPARTTEPLSAPNPYDVRLIRVHLWVNIKPIVAPENINLESFVELRNLNEF